MFHVHQNKKVFNIFKFIYFLNQSQSVEGKTVPCQHAVDKDPYFL